MKRIFHILRNSENPSVFAAFVFVTASVFSLLYNSRLFLNNYPEEYFWLAMLMAIGQNAVIWYLFALNRWVFLFFAPVLFGIGAAFNFYVVNFKIGMQIEFVAMAFDTNVQEAAGMINGGLITAVCVGIGAGLLLAAVRFYIRGLKSFKTAALLLVLMLVPVWGAKLPEPLLKEVKIGYKGANTGKGFDAMPEKYLENFYHHFLNMRELKAKAEKRSRMLLPEVGYVGPEEETVVFILTDALRPDHMQINGYERETTPHMIEEGYVSFNDMYACQTSTNKSVQCLMTRASRKDISRSLSEYSIVQMFKAAGFYTAWISAQGSLNTADREPTVLSEDADYRYFNTDVNKFSAHAYDSDLLPELDKILARPEPKKFIILHLNGSHWDYGKRYSPDQRKYEPECSRWLYDCSIEEVVNSYDNTVVATDDFIKKVTDRLKDGNSAVYFSSDHGQFLGEYGRRAHAHDLLQYKELAVVPFAVWISDSMKNAPVFKPLAANKKKITTHDNIFHSLTDCSGIVSDFINRDLSVCSDSLESVPEEY